LRKRRFRSLQPKTPIISRSPNGVSANPGGTWLIAPNAIPDVIKTTKRIPDAKPIAGGALADVTRARGEDQSRGEVGENGSQEEL
jgi:hypothetical protein